MTKEEFNQKSAEIKSKIESLRQELKEVEKEYVRTNSTIPVGTKVRIVGQKEVGILLGYEYKYGDISPIIAKMKKDGTAHATARIWVFLNNNIEPAE